LSTLFLNKKKYLRKRVFEMVEKQVQFPIFGHKEKKCQEKTICRHARNGHQDKSAVQTRTDFQITVYFP